MAKYLVRVSYTLDGVRGVLKEGGTARRDAATKAIEGVGGSVDAFYFAFGADDVILIADMPNQAAAASLGLTVTGAGGARTAMTPLITP
jgi:uncharacterized protein with GYD domain